MGERASLPWVGTVLFLAFTAGGQAAEPEPYWNSRPFSFWVEALGADDPALRERAAQSVAALALAHGGEAVLAAVPALTANLGAPEADVRESSAGALEQMGPLARLAAPTLLRLFASDDAVAVRRRAALALGRIDAASGDVIAAAGRVVLDDENAGVRASAAILLSSSGAAGVTVAPALERALADSDPHVQLYSAVALANMGQKGRVTPMVLAMLEHDDAALRAEAAGLLPAVALDKLELVAPLTLALQDHDPEVRAAAAGSLGAVGRPARPALRALWLLLSDPNEMVRERVLSAIQAIRKK